MANPGWTPWSTQTSPGLALLDYRRSLVRILQMRTLHAHCSWVNVKKRFLPRRFRPLSRPGNLTVSRSAVQSKKDLLAWQAPAGPQIIKALTLMVWRVGGRLTSLRPVQCTKVNSSISSVFGGRATVPSTPWETGPCGCSFGLSNKLGECLRGDSSSVLLGSGALP